MGSKSPLSYTDLFYITTIYDNIKYEYVYYKEGIDYILSSLSKSNVLEKSGTTIKIEIKDGDQHKFSRELNQQLSYFEDVYINTNIINYNNNYKIYEGKYFKFKSLDRPYDNLHIILGQVTYPIDWKILGVEPIELPLGIKFQVGELRPTLERENLQYEESSINLIKERIELVLDEIKEYFSDQTFEISDLKDYLTIRSQTPYLYFNKELDHKIKSVKRIGSKKDYYYKYLENINIPESEYLFSMFNVYMISGKETISISGHNINRVWKNSNTNILFKEDSNFNQLTNNYWDTHANATLIFVPKKADYKGHLQLLNILSYRYRGVKTYNDNFYTRLKAKNKEGGYTLGSAYLINTYVKEIRRYIGTLAEDYSNIPHDYAENYREEQRLKALESKNKLKEKVIYYGKYGRTDIILKDLLKYKYIFYRIRDLDDKVAYFYRGDKFMTLMKSYKNWGDDSKDSYNSCIFIDISKSQYARIKNIKELRHISEFLKVKEFQSYFYRVRLANIINNELEQITLLGRISNYYRELINELAIFRKGYYNTDFSFDELRISNTNRLYYPIIDKIEEYRKVKNDLDIFNYLDYNIPHNYLVNIIRNIKTIKRTKFNNELYKLEVKQFNNQITEEDGEERDNLQTSGSELDNNCERSTVIEEN